MTVMNVTHPAKLTPARRWALVGLSLSMLMSSIDTSIANAGLPTLAHAFSASFQEVQWIVLAYLLAITTLIVSIGRLGDIIGRRRLVLMGICLFTVASLLCGVAPTLWALIAARAMQGIGAAIMMALATAFAGEIVGKAKTGSAMGLLGTMSAIGTTVGPSIGGVLIAGLGWRAIFLVNVPLGVLNFLLAHRYLPLDCRGAQSARAPSASIWLTMFRDTALSASLVMSTLVSTVMMATLVVGPFYLSLALEIKATLVGFVLSVGPFVAALSGLPSGRLVDRIGAQSMIIVGLVGIASGCFLLSTMPVRFGIVGYLAPIGVITACYALFQTANNTAVMTDADPNQRGVISGMLSLSRNLGLIAGTSVMGAVFAHVTGTIDITAARPAEVVTGMQVTFAVAAILILVALAIAIGLSRRFPHGRPGAMGFRAS